MTAEQQADVRDRRRKGWFSIDDEIIDVYGERIGVHGVAVYSALSKRADKNEQVRIGLSWFCKKLKIGREKLLKTFDLLEREGLISVEPGDRNHVSEYTLLHVEKGGGTSSDQNHSGSNGNHPKPEAGSDENHASSDENHGGSNGNHPYIDNQTQLPNPFTKEERNEPDEPLPDDETGQCLLHLKKVKGIGKNFGELAVLVAELCAEFPNVDPVEVCRDYEFNHRVGKKRTKVHASKLRNYFRTASRIPADSSRRNGKTRSSPPPAGPRRKKPKVPDGYGRLVPDEEVRR